MNKSIAHKILVDTIRKPEDVIKKQSFDYEFISACYHEAGHALSGLYHLMNISLVQLHAKLKNKKTYITGATSYLYIEKDFIKDKDLLNIAINAEIRFLYSGLASEKSYYKDLCGSDKFPMILRWGSGDDIKSLSKLIFKYNMAESGKDRYLFKQKIFRNCRKLIYKYWEDIRLIAHALYKKKKLDFKDLKYLLGSKSKNKLMWKRKFKIINKISKLSLNNEDNSITELKLKSLILLDYSLN